MAHEFSGLKSQDMMGGMGGGFLAWSGTVEKPVIWNFWRQWRHEIVMEIDKKNPKNNQNAPVGKVDLAGILVHLFWGG